MIIKRRFRAKFVVVVVASLLFFSCKGDSEEKDDPLTITKDIELKSPNSQEQFDVGEVVKVEIKVNHPDLISDLRLFVDDSLYKDSLDLADQTIEIPTENGRVGYVNIHLSYKDGKGQDHRDNREVVFFSNITPKTIEGESIATYPHQVGSYTQGLEFYEGSLYEGTGRKGMSVLAEVDLESGQIVRSKKLPDDIFGEGITILNDSIFQISYQAGRCLVYDMEFNQLTDYYYTGQGWGLCNNGKQLLMSNGSSEIVWRDPKTFKVTKKIQVFDDQSEVAQINELELINGDLYANIYTDSRIVKIDTATGKVLSYIDFSELVGSQPPTVDYFNGIAYDKSQSKLYVTGKLWPNLYEIKIQ